MPRDKSSWQPSSVKRQRQPKQHKGPIPSPSEKAYLQDDSIPTTLQQSLLNVFRNACNKGPPAEFDEILQEIKGHLYNRDFATAFGKDEYLEAYAARWSSSRALGYAQIFSDLSPLITELLEQKQSKESAVLGSASEEIASAKAPSTISQAGDDEVPMLSKEVEKSLRLHGSNSSATLRVVCLGGGAGAEVVGLAGWLKYFRDTSSSSEQTTQPALSNLDLLSVDIADWDKVMRDLHKGIVTAPVLSKYASAAAKAANAAVLPSDALKAHFKQQDLLSIDASGIKELLADADIVTIMFTLNELYTASVPKTQRLLYALTAALRPGAMLLVVDSPGSYSTVTINGAEKKYPMQWLLDHTLVPSPTKDAQIQWQKLVSDDSRWFRLPNGLKYPIELENMRYQIHLYQRSGSQRQELDTKESA